MQQAGTEETGGEGHLVVMVQYNAFLDMLRVARNRSQPPPAFHLKAAGWSCVCGKDSSVRLTALRSFLQPLVSCLSHTSAGALASEA
eukprot:2519373-Rhodomonas_salina.2